MTAARPPLHRGHAERLLAWLATGPLGHLWSVVADMSAFALRSLLARVRASRRSSALPPRGPLPPR